LAGDFLGVRLLRLRGRCDRSVARQRILEYWPEQCGARFLRRRDRLAGRGRIADIWGAIGDFISLAALIILSGRRASGSLDSNARIDLSALGIETGANLRRIGFDDVLSVSRNGDRKAGGGNR